MKNCKKVLYFEIAGFIFTFLMMFLLHFLFEMTGENKIVAVFAAVNESVWEHTKIIFTPYLIFAIIEYFILKPEFKKFFVAKTFGLLAIDFLTIAFFYTYSGILGYEVLIVDILSAVAWAAIAFFISYKIICSNRNFDKFFGLSVIIFIALMLAYFLFTYYPPQINLFYDTVEGFYGIPAK